jgi:hypothetical protein
VKVTVDGVDADIVSANDGSVIVRLKAKKGRRTRRSTQGDIVITSSTGGTVTISGVFEYQDASEITSTKPSNGQLGTKVTIAGKLLLGKDAGQSDKTVSVKPGSVAADITSSTQTAVVVVVKKANAGKVDVVLEATSGATTTQTNGFTYTAAGVIKTVTPNAGQLGTLVVINGERLLGGGQKAASVTLVGEKATVKSSKATEVVVQASVSSKTESGDIVIVSDSGAIVTGSGLFTYKTPSKITNIKPVVGQLGTSVTISGTTLRGNDRINPHHSDYSDAKGL